MARRGVAEEADDEVRGQPERRNSGEEMPRFKGEVVRATRPETWWPYAEIAQPAPHLCPPSRPFLVRRLRVRGTQAAFETITQTNLTDSETKPEPRTQRAFGMCRN